MTRSENENRPRQGRLFNPFLRDMIDRNNLMVRLADSIDWSNFEKALAPSFCEDNRRPSIPVRMREGMHYLKHMADVSDEDVPQQPLQLAFIEGLNVLRGECTFKQHDISQTATKILSFVTACSSANPNWAANNGKRYLPLIF